MGDRLTRIATGTGDRGTTGLADGARVGKDEARVEAYGAVDELNSHLGAVRAAADVPADVRACLEQVQQWLFVVGGELATPGGASLTAREVEWLDARLGEFQSSLPPLEEFLLPGGGPASAACHIARTVCRRAERRVVALTRDAEVNPRTLTFLNRLSDLLFVLARVIVRAGGAAEELWHPRT